MLSIHHSGKATLAEAWRLAAFCLSPTSREHLGLDADRPPADDLHACLAEYGYSATLTVAAHFAQPARALGY
ncbi:hypothetical protein ACSDR0_46770 [Streptosporangium sp. G11]|uniref:hypothetical protein n=1 Tax=Streptosporangium sp. G11 TaxID=3436926 RepID=UPI003EB94843